MPGETRCGSYVHHKVVRLTFQSRQVTVVRPATVFQHYGADSDLENATLTWPNGHFMGKATWGKLVAVQGIEPRTLRI